jgi:hypothetical protein
LPRARTKPEASRFLPPLRLSFSNASTPLFVRNLLPERLPFRPEDRFREMQASVSTRVSQISLANRRADCGKTPSKPANPEGIASRETKVTRRGAASLQHGFAEQINTRRTGFQEVVIVVSPEPTPFRSDQHPPADQPGGTTGRQ